MHRLALSSYSLKVALVYQDGLTRTWAKQVRELVAKVIGDAALSCTEWRIDLLKEPAIYTAGAIVLAQADVMVFAVDEASPFPPEFYLWVNLWLQMRSMTSGALAALLGTSGQASRAHNEVRSYLHALAGQARLELFFKECEPAAEVSSNLGQEFIEWAHAA